MHSALIALGGNLGDVRKNFDIACATLSKSSSIIAKSRLYHTAALTVVSAAPQPDYLNAVIQVTSQLSAADLLQELHRIEAMQGRKRLEHWGSRTLDLDLLAYDDVISDAETLKLPHPHIAERLFVLQPLADVQPDWIHPVTKQNVSTMIHSLVNKKANLFEGTPWMNS